MPLQPKASRKPATSKNAALSSIFAANKSIAPPATKQQGSLSSGSEAVSVGVAGSIRYPTVQSGVTHSVRRIHWLKAEKERTEEERARDDSSNRRQCFGNVSTVFLRLSECTSQQQQQQQQQSDAVWWRDVTSRAACALHCSSERRRPRGGSHVLVQDGCFSQWRRAVVVDVAQTQSDATGADNTQEEDVVADLLRLFFVDRGYLVWRSAALCVCVSDEADADAVDVDVAKWPSVSPPAASGLVCRLADGVSNSLIPPTSSAADIDDAVLFQYTKLQEHLFCLLTKTSNGGEMRLIRATFVSARDSGAKISAESLTGAARGAGFVVQLAALYAKSEIDYATVNVPIVNKGACSDTYRWNFEDCVIETENNGDLWLSVNHVLSSATNLALTNKKLLDILLSAKQLSHVMKALHVGCHMTNDEVTLGRPFSDFTTEMCGDDESHVPPAMSTVKDNVCDWLRKTDSSVAMDRLSIKCRDLSGQTYLRSSTASSDSSGDKHKGSGPQTASKLPPAIPVPVPSHHKAILQKYSSIVPVWNCRPIYRSALDLCSSLTRCDLQLVNVLAVDRMFVAQSSDCFEQFETELNGVYDRLPMHPRQLDAAGSGVESLRQLYQAGSFWVARWDESQLGSVQWGRVSVLEFCDIDQQLRVYWLDYGEVSRVSFHQLRPISELLAARPVLLTEAFCADYVMIDSLRHHESSIHERFLQLVDTASVFIRTVSGQTSERRLAIIVLTQSVREDSDQMVSVIQLLSEEVNLPIWQPPVDDSALPASAAMARVSEQSDSDDDGSLTCSSADRVVCDTCGATPPRHDMLPRTDSMIYIMVTEIMSSSNSSNRNINDNNNNTSNRGQESYCYAVMPFGPLDAATVNEAGYDSCYTRQLDCSSCHTLESISRKLLVLLGSPAETVRDERSHRIHHGERYKRWQLECELSCGMVVAVWEGGVWRRARIVGLTSSPIALTASAVVSASFTTETPQTVEAGPSTPADEEPTVQLQLLDWGGSLTVPKINCLICRLPRKLQLLPHLAVTFRVRCRTDESQETGGDAGLKLRQCLSQLMDDSDSPFLLAHLLHVQVSPLVCYVDLYSRAGLVE